MNIMFPPHQSSFPEPPRLPKLPNDDGIQRFPHWAMACPWAIWIPTDDQVYAEQVADECWQEVNRIEGLLSRFIPSSEIYQMNVQVGDWLRVSAETLHCLQIAQAWHTQTNGAFDITLGSALEERRNEDGTIARVENGTKVLSGMKQLEINAAEFAARVLSAETQIDLGAIGKGYALDCCVEVLRNWSIDNALLHAGQSTVLAMGEGPEGNGWSVELRHPDQESQSPGQVLLRDRGFSASGQLLHGHHIIDPRNGRSALGKRNAWVVAPTAARSDALSTAFMVMSVEEVEGFCAQHPDVNAVLLLDNDEWKTFGKWD
jgi:thiamine biosynthesis lipoprotein